MIPIAESLAGVAQPFRVLFCDVWGVVHNGVAPFPQGVAALEAARKQGKLVVLISNSPRLSNAIPAQLGKIGVSESAYDLIVTSGDATREYVRGWAKEGIARIHYIGPPRDAAILEGLPLQSAALEDAQGVICTGPVDDDVETPDDYRATLAEIARRGLPFLCANPDIVVQRGEKLIYCAGALAQSLEAMGGNAIYLGKPHTPIYELALARCAEHLGQEIAKSEILSIGDGLKTDILGAARFGIASLLVADGIHASALMKDGGVDPGAVRDACRDIGARPIAVMARLAP